MSHLYKRLFARPFTRFTKNRETAFISAMTFPIWVGT